MIGRVISAKMQKTVSVLVEGKKTHALYNKTFVWSKKFLVRDEMGAKEGDIVVVVETRPVSKRVHWKVSKILGADVVALGEAAMKQVEEEAIAEVMPEEKEEVETVESEASAEGKAKEPEKAVKEKKTKKEKKEAKA